MYTFLRKCHLYAGLIILTFLLMYFVTGYVMIHGDWFGRTSARPAPVKRTESIAGYAGVRTPEALAAYIVERFGLPGRLIVPPVSGIPQASMQFRVVHPGTICTADVPADSDEITITTARENFAGTLGLLHRSHGYSGGWLYILWAFVYDLASFSCILFALTGVYLWWKSTKRHWPGVLCLVASCAYGLGVIFYLLYAC